MTFAVRTQIDGGTAGGGGGPTPPPSFTPVTRTYPNPGTFTETIPGDPGTGIGPAQMIVELGGPGGGGSFSPYLTRTPPGVSGSGGSGALNRSTFALTSADWGKTLTITITPGATGGDPVQDFNGRNALPSTIQNGTWGTPISMQAGGGMGGTWNPGAGGAGGVGSGAQVMVSGTTGQGNTLYPTPSVGGAPVAGLHINSGAGGNASVVPNGFGSSGLSGGAAFAYT